MRNGTEALKVILGFAIIGGLIYLFGSMFIDIMTTLYNLLDEYIWAFFAGIIAFLASFMVIGLVIRVVMFAIVLILYALAFIGAVITGQS